MGGLRGTYSADEKYTALVRKQHRTATYERPRRRWEDNIKTDLRNRV
jgi:hypothetical protein